MQNYCYGNFNGLTDHCAQNPGDNNNCDPNTNDTFIQPAGPPQTVPASNTFTTTTVPAARNVSRVKMQEVLYPGTLASQVTTQVVCHWQPWWDHGQSGGHILIGKDQHDTTVDPNSPTGQTFGQEVVAAEANEMIARGCTVVNPDWYWKGAPGSMTDLRTQYMRDYLDSQCTGTFPYTCPMRMTIDIDAGGISSSSLDTALSDYENAFGYLRDNYFNHKSYWLVDDPGCLHRAAVGFFGDNLQNNATYWQTLRTYVQNNVATCSSSTFTEPALFFQDGWNHAQNDGAFHWIGVSAWDNTNPTVQFNDDYPDLDSFYQTASTSSQTVIMSSMRAGFNDTNATWGFSCSDGHCWGRKMDRACGTLWVNDIARLTRTLQPPGNTFSGSHQIKAVLIPTWNDYEEGTAIEPGIDNCVNESNFVLDSISGTTLSWHLVFAAPSSAAPPSGWPTGLDQTIHHYVLFASSDGGATLNTIDNNITPSGASCTFTTSTLTVSCSKDLSGYSSSLQAGTTYQLYIKAIGMPSVFNHMSANNLNYTPGPCGPQIGLSPASLAFGSQKVGTTSGSSSVTLTNTANTGCSSLSVSSISTSGDFGQTNNCPASLAVNASCTINVSFMPTARGSRTGSLTVTGSGLSKSTSLSGTGVQGVISLSPTSLTFANQQINTSSASQAVTLTNTGDFPLTISSISVGSDFTQSNNCPVSPSALAVNTACTINVTFHPLSTGALSENLTVSGDGANSPQSTSLTGTGTNVIANIDDLTWSACSGSCSGAFTQLVTTPNNSADGSSRQFHYGNTTAFSNVAWTIQPGIDPNAMHFDYDFYMQVDNPSAVWSQQFKIPVVVGNRNYAFQLQCDFGGSGAWQVWDPPGNSWVTTNRACVSQSANSWDHFVLRVERVTGRTDLCTSGNCLYYKELVINGTTYPMFYSGTTNAIYRDSIAQTQTSVVTVGIRLIGNGTPVAYSTYLDAVKVTYW